MNYLSTHTHTLANAHANFSHNLRIEKMFSRLSFTLSIFFLFMFLISNYSHAQKETDKFTATNSLYLELGGSSGRYAINYGKIFYQKEKLKLNVSGGFALWHYATNLGPAYNRTTWHPVIPVEFTALWGRSKHHLEIGTGFFSYWEPIPEVAPDTFEVTERINFGAVIPLRIGYRYQKPGGGFFYRVAYTPFFIPPVGDRENWGFQPYFAGVSIGKSF